VALFDNDGAITQIISQSDIIRWVTRVVYPGGWCEQTTVADKLQGVSVQLPLLVKPPGIVYAAYGVSQQLAQAADKEADKRGSVEVPGSPVAIRANKK
jgi:hypothetical protein